MASIIMEEYELLGDTKYRSYITQIERALKYFENNTEWHDLIAALNKLSKVIASNMKYPIIPRRVVISKRLSQCLHPMLPPGVHLKALNIYDIIFKCMGTNRLAQELFLYSAGLFPLLGYAAMIVRPTLLTIYETHFVPLGERLRPGLNGLLSGILPGLEEGSENFQRIVKLLEEFCESVSPCVFYGSLWECMTSNQLIRLPAITFIIQRFDPKRNCGFDVDEALFGSDVEVMVTGMCEALTDTNVLVQRNALDLLLMILPLHRNSGGDDDDRGINMEFIVTAAITVLTRRDVSLNRRFYSWIFGLHTSNIATVDDDVTQNVNSSSLFYFNHYSRRHLVSALRTVLSNVVSSSQLNLISYRLISTLVKNDLIGSIIVQEIILDLFRSLYLVYHKYGSEHTASNNKSSSRIFRENSKNFSSFSLSWNRDSDEDSLNKDQIEIVKSANLFFASLSSPGLVWQICGQFFNSESSRTLKQRTDNGYVRSITSPGQTSVNSSVDEICVLANFFLNIISNETYPDDPSVHLPTFLESITKDIALNAQTLSLVEIMNSLKLIRRILQKIQPEWNVWESTPNKILGSDQLTSSSNNHEISMAASRRSYQSFFVEFMKHHIFAPSFTPIELIKRFSGFRPADADATKRTLFLENLLIQYTSSNLDGEFSNCCEENKVSNLNDYELPLRSGVSAMLENGKELSLVVILAFRLFVDFSSMPAVSLPTTEIDDTAATKTSKLTKQNCFSEYSFSFLDIPAWLQYLMVCACHFDIGWHGEALLEAAHSFLEMFSLQQSFRSFMSGGSSNSMERRGFSANTKIHSPPPPPCVIVVMTPLVNENQFDYLFRHTIMPQVLATKLWNGLGKISSGLQPLCVRLLYQLHNIVPSANFNAVEGVMARSLGDGPQSADAFHRFTLLWHLSRGEYGPSKSTTATAASASPRTFDICLLKMLNNLNQVGGFSNYTNGTFSDAPGPLKTLAETWLVHAMSNGDISRIMEPLFLMLLDPNTSRLGIINSSVKRRRLKAHSNKAVYSIKSNGIKVKAENEGEILHICVLKGVSDSDLDDEKSSAIFERSKVSSVSLVDDFDNVVPSSSYHLANSCSMSTLNVNPFALVPPSSECYESYNKGYNGNVEEQQSNTNGIISNVVNDAKDNVEVVGNAVNFVFSSEISNDDSGVNSSSPSGRQSRLTQAKKTDNNNVICEIEDLLLDLVHSAVAEASNDSQKSSNEERIRSDKERATSVRLSCLNLHESEETEEEEDRVNISIPPCIKHGTNVHPFHSHLLIYTQVTDSRRVMYALQCIRNIISSNSRMALCCLSSSSLNPSASTAVATSTVSTARCYQIQTLLRRHWKSVEGFGFAGSLAEEEESFTAGNWNSGGGISGGGGTLMEALIIIILYYMNSFYTNVGNKQISNEEIRGNREVQLMAVELLNLLVSELILIIRDNGAAFATFIRDVFNRCQVQKLVLLALRAGVYDMGMKVGVERSVKPENSIESFYGSMCVTLTEDILAFNEVVDSSATLMGPSTCQEISNFSEAFQVQSLRLILSLVMLEQIIHRTSPSISSPTDVPLSSRSIIYISNRPIPEQPLFLDCIIGALNLEAIRHLHPHWTSLVNSSLPFLVSETLSNTALKVMHQLYRNVERLAPLYSLEGQTTKSLFYKVPADYLISQLSSLTFLVHFCLLDSSSQISPAYTAPSDYDQSTTFATDSQAISSFLTNFMHTFLSAGNITGQLSPSTIDSSELVKKKMLTTLPRLLVCVSRLWSATASNQMSQPAGSTRAVRAKLLNLVSPIARYYTTNFLAAVALVWKTSKKNLPSQELVVVDLVGSIRALPVANVIDTVRQVLRSPPITKSDKPRRKLNYDGKSMQIEVSILRFLHAYLANCPITQVVESWTCLAELLRDCLHMSQTPPVLFMALSIIDQFIHAVASLPLRKEQKEIQELTNKLIDAVTTVAGSNLEHTTWLRRNLIVREDNCEDASSLKENLSDSNSEEDDDDIVHLTMDKPNGNRDKKYAVSALRLLGEIMGPLLDIIYASEEKEKVVSLLQNVMPNVFPYLRNHRRSNLPSYRASSVLLANLSEYQYSRKVWRREALDLLCDQNFFQTDIASLKQWRIIIDNLMTHDKTTFKEFITRLSSVSQSSSSLSLFSSKEQEMEQRAFLLKRLAFVIFCSDVDQYIRQMPEIQERLSECLRIIPPSPNVLASVFLCFRVLLVRITSIHITSLWPSIITEMVQIFSFMEQELTTDTEEWSSHLSRLSTLDSSWIASNSNVLASYNNPLWMSLYLSVCKLLDLALVLPADWLPQFQMYRWAFVTEQSHTPNKGNESITPDFVPYVVRVALLLLAKCTENVVPITLMECRPVLNMTSITSLDDLTPFLATLCHGVTRQQAKDRLASNHVRPTLLRLSSSSQNNTLDFNIKKHSQIIDESIRIDFIEPLSK